MLAKIVQGAENAMREANFNIVHLGQELYNGLEVSPIETPAVDIGIETAAAEVIAQKDADRPVVTFLITVQNLGDEEKDRRMEILELIGQIERYINKHDLGLTAEGECLENPLRYLSLNNVTPSNFADAGYIIYQLNFWCNYIIQDENTKEENLSRLCTIVNNFNYTE